MKKQSVLVLIPTYNEAENIEQMIHRIMAVDMSASNTTIAVFIMDDESPDGTLDIVKRLEADQYPGRIHYRTGKKKGLGAAMFKSFGHFAEDYTHDILVTMDADFSHQPEQIPDLVRPLLDEGFDVAVGSRYIEGGLIPGTWPLLFIVRTRVASFVARWLGGIDSSLRELTTNFRAMRRPVIANMPYKTFNAVGYGFQMQLINYLTGNGYKVKEVPISFHSRVAGDPKGRFSDIVEFFRIAYNLNSDSPAKQVLRFATIGASGVVVNLLALFILSSVISIPYTTYLAFVAIQISIVWNFIFHTKFTFKRRTLQVRDNDTSTAGQILQDFAKYNASTILVQILTLTVFTTLHSLGVYILLAQLVGIVAAFLLNYYVATKYVWSQVTA